MRSVAILAGAVTALGLAAMAHGAAPGRSAQSDYIEYCAGCHGIQGDATTPAIPALRGQVGRFLCTPEGRDYLIRLPNVAHAPLRDPADLAALMNFVAFRLGGTSAPADARPFEAAEVERLRQTPLVPGTGLKQLRARLVRDVARACPAGS
ncbi:c-type cytochrome [Sphingomonas sp. CJ20]